MNSLKHLIAAIDAEHDRAEVTNAKLTSVCEIVLTLRQQSLDLAKQLDDLKAIIAQGSPDAALEAQAIRLEALVAEQDATLATVEAKLNPPAPAPIPVPDPTPAPAPAADPNAPATSDWLARLASGPQPSDANPPGSSQEPSAPAPNPS